MAGEIGLSVRGEKVRELHDDLKSLGIPLSSIEIRDVVYGAGTQAAVRLLQSSAGLAQTGEFDTLTRAALDKALQVAAYKTPRVEGRLVTEHGTPAANLVVHLYRRPPGGRAERIGVGITDADGYYRLEYPVVPGQPLTIELRIVDASRNEIPISRPKASAGRYELLNLVVPASAVPPLDPEWDRLVAAVDGVLGGFGALHSDDEDIDPLAVAHAHTGWDARLLALAGAAVAIAGRGKLDRRVAYALLRYGLPTETEALAAVPEEKVRAVLGRAVDDGVIALSPGDISDETAAFAAFATRTRHAARRPGAVSTYGAFLAATGLNPEQRERFDRLVVEHSDDPAALWEAAQEAGIGDTEIGRLRSQGRLAALTSQNLPLTSKLLEIGGAADPGPGGLRALVAADLHTTGAWLALLQDLAGRDDDELTALVPPEYLDGATPQQAAEAYAGELAQRIRVDAPTTVVGRMLRTGQITVDQRLGEPVAQLIERAEDLDFTFASRPLGPFLAEHRRELVADLDPDIRDSAIAQFERMQRLYLATPSHEALAAAVAAEFTSAHQIAMIEQRKFLERHATSFPSVQEAELTHRRSQRIMAITLAHTGARMQRGGPRIFALSGPPDAEEADQPAAEGAIEAILGEQDFCACEHCRSLLGPAAYFVDLLHFLDIDDASWNALPGAEGSAHPFEVLDKRRPDLAHLPLTCENTTTVLPYIDVVNEIMEARVAPEALGAATVHDTGAATSADLLAEPQSVLAEAYDNDKLGGAKYPLNLPFDLWLETVRGHLGRVGIGHADLLDALRPAGAPYPPEAALTERLGLTPAETKILTARIPLTGWHLLYGYPTEQEARRDLSSAKTLARRLGVTYLELDALVRTWFVNPQLDVVATLRAIGLDVRDVLRSRGAAGVAPFDADEQIAFDARLAAATHRYAGEDNAWEPFDAATWVEDTWSDGGFDEVLLLADADTECSFDNTVLRFAGTAPGILDPFLGRPELDMVLVRLNLLVRLWRRLDWTLDELDLALRALIRLPAALTANRIGRALEVALPSLSRVDEIARRLGIVPRQRVDLVALLRPMSTVGPGSTYARLFLSPRTDPTFDHPHGAFLTAGRTLAAHRTAVQGALGMSAADVDAVLAAAPAPVNLTLDTVSLLYRHTLLAKAMSLTVPELITLGELVGIDPFTETLDLLDAHDDLRAAGLTVADLAYLFAHRFDPVGPFRPDPTAVLALAREVGDGVRLLEAEHSAPSDPALLGDDVVARELGLVLPADLAGEVVAMWQRQLVHRESESGIGEADLVDPAAVAEFDEVTVEHRPDPEAPASFVQVLSYRGVPRPDRTDAVRQAAPALGSLLAGVIGQAAARQARISWLIPDDDAVLDAMFGVPPAGAANHESDRRAIFAAVVMPTVLATLRRRFVVSTMASALTAAAGDTAPGIAESLLTRTGVADVFGAVGASGLTVTTTDLAGTSVVAPEPVATPTTPAPAGEMRIAVDGYLQVPVTGTYLLGLTISSAGDTASLRIGEDAAPLLTRTAPAERRRVPVDLQAGVLYRFSLQAHRDAGGAAEPLAGTVAVDVGDLIVDGNPVGAATGLSWRPQTVVDAFTSAHLLASKALLLAGRIGASERELRRLGLVALPAGPVGVPADGATYGLLAHLALQEEVVVGASTSATVRGLLAYVALRAEMSGGGDELLDVLAMAAAPGATEDGVYGRIATLTRREPPTVATITRHLGRPLPDLAHVRGLRRLWKALVLVERLGVGADAVLAAAIPAPDRIAATGLRDAVRARHDTDAWRAVAKSVNDPLRRRRRDALVTYLLHHLGLDPARPELLYNELLLDPGTEPVVQTSRLRLAISCVQLFIQRCLLSHEPDVRPAVIDRTRWAWMKRYRVWEANRKIFLYPENWLEPELRDGRTHLFTALTGTLLQGDITDRLAEDAFVTYLRGLADIARLDIACVWQEPDALHVIGRDYNNPRSYYYRRSADRMWTPWEPVGAQIEGDHVTAVVYQGRLHVFWVTFLEKGAVQVPGSEGLPEVNVQAQLHWTELISGQWTPRVSSALLSVGGPLPSFNPASVFVSASVERSSGGTEASVTIHLDGDHYASVGTPSVYWDGHRYVTEMGHTIEFQTPITDSFRLVSRSGPPSLVRVDRPDYSIGIENYSSLNRQHYRAKLAAQSFPLLLGGTVLAQARPFTAVSPPRLTSPGATSASRAVDPFFYVDRPGVVGETLFNGHNTFFVERYQVPPGLGWVGRVSPTPPFDFEEIVPTKPLLPQRVQLLATGQSVLIPIDPVDPVSIRGLERRVDWAAVPNGVVLINGRQVGASGRVSADSIKNVVGSMDGKA